MIGATVLVVAKAPVPGLAKTRLAATLGDVAAADIAAAAILDTLDAVAETPVARRVVAFTGELADACRSDEIAVRLGDFDVVPQRGDDFADRLANAHADAAGVGPVLQIGMDTPQVDARLLGRCAERLVHGPALLGPAVDGGWWVLGVHAAADADVLRGVPMSQSDTGELTLKALRGSGIDVELVDTLADVDTIDDVPAVRRACRRDSRFAVATEGIGGQR